MKAPKTYKFFKVKYQYNDVAYLETAIILEFKKPITQKEAIQICEKTYGTTNGFCVGMTLEYVINHIKIGLTLQEVVKYKGTFKKGKAYISRQIEVLDKENNNYVLGEDSINGIAINERIQQEELFDYQIRDREDFIENLVMWISECKTADKQLMKDDLKMLMDVKDEYIFSSISTNDYIYQGCSEFETTCKELLELNQKINDEDENK